MRWRFRRPALASRTSETLARLDVLVEILDAVTSRLEESAKSLDDLTNRHLHALETNGSSDAET